jgi:hypothetical protein
MLPSADQVLAQLEALASTGRGVAFIWHCLVLLGLGALWLGPWVPSRRLAGMASALPLVSAAVLAGVSENPFNAAVVGAAAAALLTLGLRLSTDPVKRAGPVPAALGALTVAYALLYPHFVPGGWPYAVLMAPVGVLPCPSLALVLGLALLSGGFGSRAWSLVAAGVSLFYALFGMFRLGVWLDAGLLAAAVALIFFTLLPHGTSRGAMGAQPQPG